MARERDTEEWHSAVHDLTEWDRAAYDDPETYADTIHWTHTGEWVRS